MLRTVSMMQPYLFPYLGYFQLIALSDVFVLGDDLQFVRGSWMNRNRILVNGQPKLISFPLKKGHQTERINQRWLCDDFDKEAAGLMLTLERCYAKAPQRDAVLPLIRSILQCPERNLALFTENSLRCLCAYLNIRCIESPYLDHLCVFLLNHPEAAKSCFFDPANLARGE